MSFWHPSTLLNKFRPVFNPLESRVIDEVRGRLGPAARALLDRQLREVNYVQRHAKREVNCYSMRGDEVWRDPATLFPNKADDLRFASVTFAVPGDPAPLSADLHLARGRLFSIVFSADPTAFRDRAGDLRVTSVRIFHDPMRVEPEGRGRATTRDVPLTGWLRGWAERYRMNDISPPLSPEERERLLGGLPAALPGDYLEAAAQCDGFVVEGCTVKGPSQIYDVVTPEQDYYVLAEIEGRGVLAVSANAGPQIYFLDYEGGEPIQSGTSFRSAVEAFLAQT